MSQVSLQFSPLQHIAIIMDGNGRWAEQRGLPRPTGYHYGVKTLRSTVECMVKNDFSELTVYAFSSENWQRPKTEISLLLDLFVKALDKEVEDLHQHEVKLHFIGDLSRFSEQLQSAIQQAEQMTESNTGLCLNVAVNYGGRWDIVNACRQALNSLQQMKKPITALDEELLGEKLALHDSIAPDLLIRTGGEQRLSNFLLWQLAYTELYFIDCLWPDFSDTDLLNAIDWYKRRERRFGQTSAQLKSVRGT